MDFKTQASMGLSLLKQYGIRDFYYRFREWYEVRGRNRAYQAHPEYYFPSHEELEAQREEQWAYAPLVSIVVPTYETDETFLRQLLDSVLGQTYPHLELCLADGSQTGKVEQVVRSYQDPRIVYRRLEQNGGISENTNCGFAMASGEYLALLDHDDLLAANALYEMVKALNEVSPRPDMLYSDEDKMVGDSAAYCDPSFKPDYNEELLRRNNYICHFLLFSRKLLEEAGGLDSAYDGAQDHEFVLRCRKHGARFHHIPKILYHWRIHPSSTAYDPGSKLYAYENGKKAILAYLRSQGVEAEVGLTKDLGVYQVSYLRNRRMRVAILSDTRDHAMALKASAGKSKGTEISCYDMPDISNQGIEGADADFILLARHWMVPKGGDWLERLLAFCQEGRVGAVSGSIQTPRRRIIQNGMKVSREGKVSPLFEGLPEIYRGYCHRADIPANVSTLTLDFVLLSKKAWEEAGKFTEGLSPTAQEVDFFARMRACGYEAVCDSRVKVICHEGHRKGYGMEPGELERLKKKWGGQWQRGDLAYNPNFQEGDGRFVLRGK